MSEFHAPIFKIESIEKHPQADTLSITKFQDYPVIFKTGTFNVGDLAVHVPVDSIMPSTPEWEFLGKGFRVKAKKIRGIFSIGMLAKVPEGLKEGHDALEALGIKRYEVPEPLTMGGDNESCPIDIPRITDFESIRRYPNVIQEGEEVWISEKIHGCNARYLHDGTRLWVASHRNIKKDSEVNLWWKVSHRLNLEERLAKFPNIVFFGEVFGKGVQDLTYGTVANDYQFRVFDCYDMTIMKYMDFEPMKALVESAGLTLVPILYKGPWKNELKSLSEGITTISNDHVREGVVIKPVVERWEHAIGRVALKLVGEQYLLRKES